LRGFLRIAIELRGGLVFGVGGGGFGFHFRHVQDREGTARCIGLVLFDDELSESEQFIRVGGYIDPGHNEPFLFVLQC
jgi:hypothetical protein